MTIETKHTPEAEKLADAILKAAGSGLRHYSMAKTREAIFAAAQAEIEESHRELLEALEDCLAFIAEGYSNKGQFNCDWHTARSAIRKARGETKLAA